MNSVSEWLFMSYLSKSVFVLSTVLTLTLLPPEALGQEPTTAPSPGMPPQDSDPNRMANDALELLELGTPEAKERAALIADKLGKIAPQLPLRFLLGARMLAMAGNGPQAIRYYEIFKKTDEGKNDYRPYAEMGRLYMRSKSLRTARRHLEDAQKLAPEQDPKNQKFVRAEIMMDLANVLHQLDDKAEAVRIGREAANQARTDARIQIQFSRLQNDVNPTETKECRDVAARAISMLLTDLEAAPTSIPKLSMLREALMVVQQTWINEVRLQQENAEPVHFLSLATQDVAEITNRIALVAALEYEERAVSLDGSKAEYKIRLAEIEAMLGPDRTALEKLDAVLKADPDNAEALAMKTRIATTPKRKIGVAAGL